MVSIVFPEIHCKPSTGKRPLAWGKPSARNRCSFLTWYSSSRLQLTGRFSCTAATASFNLAVVVCSKFSGSFGLAAAFPVRIPRKRSAIRFEGAAWTVRVHRFRIFPSLPLFRVALPSWDEAVRQVGRPSRLHHHKHDLTTIPTCSFVWSWLWTCASSPLFLVFRVPLSCVRDPSFPSSDRSIPSSCVSVRSVPSVFSLRLPRAPRGTCMDVCACSSCATWTWFVRQRPWLPSFPRVSTFRTCSHPPLNALITSLLVGGGAAFFFLARFEDVSMTRAHLPIHVRGSSPSTRTIGFETLGETGGPRVKGGERTRTEGEREPEGEGSRVS